MRKLALLLRMLVTLGFAQILHAQETLSLQQQQQLERLSVASSSNVEDESLSEFLEHPLSVNQATEAEWIALGLVPLDQIHQLLAYKNMMGDLVSIYELQAVPGWDPILIRKILPYIQLSEPIWFESQFADRFKKGSHELQWRSGIASQNIQESKTYEGNPSNQYLRYRYQYKNLVRWHMMIEKDAGEVFFKRSAPLGFDMLSAHIAFSKIGIVRHFVVGDYTLQLGQGLLIWQGLAFGKSLSLLSVKRQGAAIKDYQSSGESNFFRGSAVHISYRNWDILSFASFRRMDAIVEEDTSITIARWMKSWVGSGYHRTDSEIAHQSSQKVFSGGVAIHYQFKSFQWGFQFMEQKFSIPLKRGLHLYEKFELEGNRLQGASIDYSFNLGNAHVFGEFAKSSPSGYAFIHGMLMHPDPRLGLALLYRNISRDYNTLYGNAFTERSVVQNEKGFYVGINFKSGQRWQWDVYGDHYKFPWLTFRSDAPSYGMDYQLQVTHTPTKKISFHMRVHAESAYRNLSGLQHGFRRMAMQRQWQWRTDVQQQLNSRHQIHLRMEWMWASEDVHPYREVGYLFMGSTAIKPMRWLKKIDLSISYIETIDGIYRLYHYEPDVGSGYAIRGFSGQGLRWATIMKKEWKYGVAQKTFGLSIKFSQTLFLKNQAVASELRLMVQQLW